MNTILEIIENRKSLTNVRNILKVVIVKVDDTFFFTDIGTTTIVGM